MDYISIPGSAKEWFVLFHGTGGNEYSLLSVTGEIDPHASILSFLGDEGSGEGRRFFQPLVDGKLVRKDFEQKADEFLALWDQLKPSGANVTFIGYSNGANFILGLLEKHPELADRVVLLHPSNLGYTFEKGADSPLLITTGATDTLSNPGEVLQLKKQLEEKFPQTELKLLDGGHQVTAEEVRFVAEWVKARKE